MADNDKRDNNSDVKSKIKYRKIEVKDAERVFTVVNAAYEKEKGSAGVAFKNADRYFTVDQVQEDILQCEGGANFFVVGEAEGEIVACVRAIIAGKRCDFGPFAVLPGWQGHGIGSALLQQVESGAKAAGCEYCEIEVVNHRTDLFPFYQKKGFQQSGSCPCDAAHNCDTSTLTRASHFIHV